METKDRISLHRLKPGAGAGIDQIKTSEAQRALEKLSPIHSGNEKGGGEYPEAVWLGLHSLQLQIWTGGSVMSSGYSLLNSGKR